MYLCKINLINLFVISLFLIVLLLPAQAADITVGLLSADKALGEVANAAYDWAKISRRRCLLLIKRVISLLMGQNNIWINLLCCGCFIQKQRNFPMPFYRTLQ